jgi:hypothetical protein
MAASASRRRDAGSVAGSRVTAMPKLAVRKRGTPPSMNGARSAEAMRCATVSASVSSSTASMHAVSSSPPNRERTSPGRSTRLSRCATLQELVAALVAQGVVDDLEVVDVGEDHGDAAAGLRGAAERLTEPLLEPPAVRQAR